MSREEKGIIPESSVKPAKYAGPEQTAAVKTDTIRECVKVQAGLLFERPTEKVHLTDVSELIEATKRYVAMCEDKGLIPGFQGLAVVCGTSRRALYKYLAEHPDTPSGIFLEKARCAFTAARQNAVDKGAAAESMSIFLMKNSYQSYVDKVEIQPIEPKSPLEELDVVAARQRLIESVPDEDDY